MSELARVVEALLFLSPEPLSLDDLADACEVEPEEILTALSRLREHYAEGWRGVVVRELAHALLTVIGPNG